MSTLNIWFKHICIRFEAECRRSRFRYARCRKSWQASGAADEGMCPGGQKSRQRPSDAVFRLQAIGNARRALSRISSSSS